MTLCDLVDMSHVRKETVNTVFVSSTKDQGNVSLILDTMITKIVTLIFQLHVCSKYGYPDARIHGHKTRY